MPRLANAIARLRGKQASTPAWTPEAAHDDAWTPFRRPQLRQTKGRIFAAMRNAHHPVNADHQNRAGHRLYVKLNQPRYMRKTLGMGKWRKHRDTSYESVALQTALPPRAGDRRDFRRSTIESDRASRRARGRRITPVK